MATNRDVKYLNRDFNSFRNSLIEFSQTYFPSTYTDFSPASPGMLFIEMASYVGDVLSFYLDNQIQENFIQYARQNPNLYTLAYTLGYRPKVTGVATADIEFYQQVPSIQDISSSTWVPDFNYALNFDANTQIKSNLNAGTFFLVEDTVDFTFSSSLDPTDVSVYQIGDDRPEYFLLKKTRKGISAKINTQNFTFATPTKYSTITINSEDIIGILDIVDSDGNTWYEVPYLAQETILNKIKNKSTFATDPNLDDDSSVVPYILESKKIQRRFVTRFKSDNQLEIQFGAGSVNDNDANIVPNSDNVGLGLPFIKDKLTTAYSPTNFLYTSTYGIAPSNTTLTVRYLTGGGLGSNVPSNVLTIINNPGNIKFTNSNLDPTTAQYIYNSVAINNPNPAVGGKDGDTVEELRLNSLNTFQTQLRTVTQEDYLIRALSLPSEYGSIAKVYVEPEKVENLLPGEIPSILNLYVLAFNSGKQLTLASTTLKQNLKTYLSQYRIINDSIRIKDAFIVNIGVDFELILLPNYNSNEIINKCIIELKNFFNIDNWQINQPIVLRDLYILLDKVEGVQTVKTITIYNKVGENVGYSQYAYDINGATQNNIIYPSLDPCIFEVKYPNFDIRGKVTSF
jgi:hypothetical protein